MNIHKLSPLKDPTSVDHPHFKVQPLSTVNQHPTAARTLSLLMLALFEQIFVLLTVLIRVLMSLAILPMTQPSTVAAQTVHMVREVLVPLPAKEVLPVGLLATQL